MAPKKHEKKKAPRTFDLLGDDSFVSAVNESLMGLEGVSLIGTRDVRNGLLHIPPLYLQSTFNSWGILNGTMMDILGGEGLGKTTLILTFLGWAMMQNSPSLYVETENKPIFDLDPRRAMRALSTDPTLARKMFKALTKAQAFTIRDAIEAIETWGNKLRDPKSPTFVPKHIPIVAALDTFSKLLGDAEAAGIALYGDDVAKGEAKQLGGGSNFEAAKLAQAWCRRLPNYLKHRNMILILGRHQNEKVDMAAGKFGGGVFMSAETADSLNKTSRGGKAFGQNAALQIILSRFKTATASVQSQNVRIGEDCRLTVAKSSFGPPLRCTYRITQVPRFDTATYQEPAINFAPYTPEWLHEKNLLTVSKKNVNCYSCKELGLVDASAEQFYASLQADEELMDRLGSRLGLVGYAPSHLDDAGPKAPEQPVEPETELEPRPVAELPTVDLNQPAENPELPADVQE